MGRFRKGSGDYAEPNDPIGEWNDTVMTSVPPPPGDVLAEDKTQPLHFAAGRGRWSQETNDAYNAVYDGKPITSAFVRAELTKVGLDPDHPERYSRGQRIRACNMLVRRVRELELERDESMLERIRAESVLNRINARLTGVSVPDSMERGGLPRSFFEPDPHKMERKRLHDSLGAWSRGPLRIERPPGSSLHHLAEYSQRCGKGAWTAAMDDDSAQVIVVENDWGAAVPPMEGQWRVPFEIIYWEFRISGVRVIVLTDASVDIDCPAMILVYGRDGVWVTDDYMYHIGSGTMRKETKDRQPVEFPRVAQMVHDCIRASCIMMDAQVARQEHVPASPKLSEKRQREGRTPPRDHYVVRLLRTERRYLRDKVAGPYRGDRAAQRGHWRKGTWVHFDDQDSGQEQYVNGGGFVVSRTWRRWHFAGDPNNIIHKEYRL